MTTPNIIGIGHPRQCGNRNAGAQEWGGDPLPLLVKQEVTSGLVPPGIVDPRHDGRGRPARRQRPHFVHPVPLYYIPLGVRVGVQATKTDYPGDSRTKKKARKFRPFLR
jgi:hypothetical protein